MAGTSDNVDQSNQALQLHEFSAGSNRITRADYSYDNAGNLLNEPGKNYNYDGENRLVLAVAGGATSTYWYDADGRRVKKVVGGVGTVYVYNAAGQLIAEYTNTAPGTGGTKYLTADTLGSTRLVTSGSGEVKARYDYLPFGQEIGEERGGRGAVVGYNDGETLRQKFVGYERDNETGLDFAQARYYASAQGRFNAPDPFLSSGSIYDPRTWNRYSYTLNNSLRYVDPFGLYEWDANATDEQKKSFRQAWLDVKKARDSFKEGSAKYDRLNAVLTAYGEEGEKNGVTVGFEKFTGKDKDLGGKATPDFQTDAQGKVTANVKVLINTSVLGKRNELATVTAHEGQHVADAQAFAALDWVNGNVVNSPLNRNQYQLEFRGYEVTSFMLEAQGADNARYGDQQLWNRGWKEPDQATLKRTEAINKFLEKSSAYPNSKPSKPGRRYIEP